MHRSFFAFERFLTAFCACAAVKTNYAAHDSPQKRTTAAHGSRFEGRLAATFSLLR